MAVLCTCRAKDGIIPTQLFPVNRDVDKVNKTHLSELETEQVRYIRHIW